MALISTSTAAHTAIHENLEGPELVKPILDPLDNDLLPILGKFPVIRLHIPFTWLSEETLPAQVLVEIFNHILLGGVAIVAGLEHRRRIHPVLLRNGARH